MKVRNIFLQTIHSKKNEEWVGYQLIIEFVLEDGSVYQHRAGMVNASSADFFTLTKVLGVSVHD